MILDSHLLHFQVEPSILNIIEVTYGWLTNKTHEHKPIRSTGVIRNKIIPLQALKLVFSQYRTLWRSLELRRKRLDVWRIEKDLFLNSIQNVMPNFRHQLKYKSGIGQNCPNWRCRTFAVDSISSLSPAFSIAVSILLHLHSLMSLQSGWHGTKASLQRSYRVTYFRSKIKSQN